MNKKLLAMIIVGVLCMGALSRLDTKQSKYVVVRAEASEDASTLAGVLDLTTSGNFGNKSATAFEYRAKDDGSDSGINNVEFIMCAGDAANDTFNAVAYAYRAFNGPARRVCTVACTLGTQAVVIFPQGGTATSKFWVDTMVITSTWDFTVVSSDETGSNGVASVSWDNAGNKFIKWYIYNADGSATEADLITIYGSNL